MTGKKADEKFSRVLGRGSARPARKSFISFFFVIIFFLIGYHFWTAVNFDNIKYIKIAGVNIKVELALTKEAQEIGLSGRQGLNSNEGVLFVFDHPDKYPFWMKDMNFAIDIIWLALSEGGDGKDIKVIYIKKYARPEEYPNTYIPNKDAKYVLEVVAGFSEKNNLKEGDRVEFLY